MTETPLALLLVDADEARATAIGEAFASTTLANRPVALTVARTCADAEVHRTASPPGLILMTLDLPGGGLDLITSLQAEASCPIVAMMPPEHEHAVGAALQAGATDYILLSGKRIAHLPGRARQALRTWHHINRRRYAEEALRRSELKYAKVFHAIPHSITISSLRTNRLIDVNDHFLAVTGLKRAEALAQTALDLKMWISPAARAQLIERLQQHGRVRNFEVQIQIRPNQRVTCLVSAEQMDLDGEPCMVCVTRNISERKRAEEAIKHSQERLQVLFEYAPDAYYLHDLMGVFIDGNKAAEALTGYERDELIGKSFMEANLLPAEQLPKALAALSRNILGYSTGPDEFSVIRQDGGRVPVEIRTYPVKFQKRRLVLGLARDISKRKQAEEALQKAKDELEQRVAERTAALSIANEQLQLELLERKRAEHALQQSEERFRTLVEHAPEAIVVSDVTQGHFIECNSNAEALFGLPRAQLLQTGPAALSPAYQPDGRRSYDAAFESMRRAVAGETPVFEWTHLNANGEEVPCEVRLIRLPSAENVLIRASVTDITERKHAEEKLRLYHDHLEELVEERTAALQKTNQRLRQEIAERQRAEEELKHEIAERKRLEEQIRHHNEELEELIKIRTSRLKDLEHQQAEIDKLAATGRMAAGIAHEINNPLASIMSSFELIAGTIPQTHPRYDFVRSIEQDLNRVATIIRHMYNLYKPVQESAQRFSIETVLEEIATLLEPHCRQQEVRLTIDASAAHRAAYLPQMSVHQVLSNVIQNAIDASEQGETVEVLAATHAETLTVTVIDRGCGIATTDQEQVFEPFFSSKQTGRMGLGLAISKSLVGAMGGRITFESTVGTGTVFHITLPLALPLNTEAWTAAHQTT